MFDSVRKTEKIFSAHNEQDSMKHGEKWFPEKIIKTLTYIFFGPSHSRYVLIRAEIPLPSSCFRARVSKLR